MKRMPIFVLVIAMLACYSPVGFCEFSSYDPLAPNTSVMEDAEYDPSIATFAGTTVVLDDNGSESNHIADPEAALNAALIAQKEAEAESMYNSIVAKALNNPEPSVIKIDTQTYWQPNGYYCGPAAAMQAIHATGVASVILGLGADKTTRMHRIASVAGTTTNGTNFPGMRKALNTYTNHTYAVASVKSADPTSKLMKCIALTLNKNYAPVPCVRRSRLSYEYGTGNSGHYITVTGISFNSNKVALYDSNKNSKASGRSDGYHTITVANLKQAMVDYDRQGGRNLLY